MSQKLCVKLRINGSPDENLEQARMNVKAGFIACINFVGSFQLHTPKQITFFIRKYRQVIDYLFVQKVRNDFSSREK